MRSTIYKDLRSRKTPSGTAFLRNSVDAVDLIGLMVYILTIVSTLQSNQRGEHIMETYTFLIGCDKNEGLQNLPIHFLTTSILYTS